MRFRLRHEHFGAAAPDHDEPIELEVRLERSDVCDDLLGQVFLMFALLDVRALEPLHVALIEDGGPRADRLELRPDLVEQRRFDDACRPRGRIAVVFEDIPAGEDELVEIGQRHKLLDQRRPAISAFAQADRAHLGKRANGFGQAAAHGFHSGHKGRGHRSHTGNHDAQLSLRRGNMLRFLRLRFFALFF